MISLNTEADLSKLFDEMLVHPLMLCSNYNCLTGAYLIEILEKLPVVSLTDHQRDNLITIIINTNMFYSYPYNIYFKRGQMIQIVHKLLQPKPRELEQIFETKLEEFNSFPIVTKIRLYNFITFNWIFFNLDMPNKQAALELLATKKYCYREIFPALEKLGYNTTQLQALFKNKQR